MEKYILFKYIQELYKQKKATSAGSAVSIF